MARMLEGRDEGLTAAAARCEKAAIEPSVSSLYSPSKRAVRFFPRTVGTHQNDTRDGLVVNPVDVPAAM